MTSTEEKLARELVPFGTAPKFWKEWFPKYVETHPEFWKDWKIVAWDFAEALTARELTEQRERGHDLYQHYKGDIYRKIVDARSSENRSEELVVYQSCKTGAIWVRPKAMFEEILPDGTPRFRKVELTERQERGGEASESAIQLAEKILWSHESDNRRIAANHPSVESLARRIEAYASSRLASDAELEAICKVICESHIDTTIADHNINDPCPLCAASSRLAEVSALIREAIKAHDALEGSAPNFELALRNRLSGRMFRLAQEIGDENV